MGYLRGVNAFTFDYFIGYDAQAGNERAASYNFLANYGMKLIRLITGWERLQTSLGATLDAAELARLDTEITRITDAGLLVLLDLHNYAHYTPSGGSTVYFGQGITTDQFANVWTQLAEHYNATPGVYGYDLMNEPYNLNPNSTATDDTSRDGAMVWEQFSQAAVDAIRATGSTQTLYIEGYAYSDADLWETVHPQAWITDPLDKFVYSMHQYFDGDFLLPNDPTPDLRYSTYESRYNSGAYDYSPHYSPDLTFNEWQVAKLTDWTDWLAANNARGHVGEVGWPSREVMIASGLLDAQQAATEAASWNVLAEEWFQHADTADLDVTYFVATGLSVNYYPNSPTGLPSPTAGFVHDGGNGYLQDANGNPILNNAGQFQPNVIDQANSQYYDVLVHHLSRPSFPVTYDSTGSGGTATNSNSPITTSWQHAAAAGAYVVVYAACNGVGFSAPDWSATYGGTPMTLLGKADFSDYIHAAAFDVANPPVDVQTVTVTAQSQGASFYTLSANSVSYNSVTALGQLSTSNGVSTDLLSAGDNNAGSMISQAFVNDGEQLSGYSQDQRFMELVSGNNSLLIGDSSNVGSVSFEATAASSAHWLSLLLPLYNTPRE